MTTTASPTIAAIDRCRAVFDEYGRVCKLEPPWRPAPEHKKWEEAENAVAEKWEAAFDDMLTTPPKTKAEAAALIRCYIDIEGRLGNERCFALLDSLLAYLEP